MIPLSFPLIVSIVGTVITGIFAALVLRRWAQRRKPYLMAWGIGLVLYFLGMLSQVILYFVWSPFFFGLWYWSGALMVAAWLGQGTTYLLVRRGSIARNLQMALLLVTVMTLPWTIFLTDFNEEAWKPGSDMTQIYRTEADADGNITIEGIMSLESRGTVRFFSPIMNAWGTIALVGGALYSARLFRRKQILRNRMLGNWFIAAGGILPALGGVLIRLGDPSFKYFGELGGAILIFIGFLLATQRDDAPEREAKSSASPAAAD